MITMRRNKKTINAEGNVTIINKKKKGRGKFVAGCVCTVTVLLLIGNFGLGGNSGWGLFGTGGSGDGNGAGGFTYTPSDPETNGQGQVVTIEGSTISHNSVEITLDELGELLVTYADGTWELRSERAIAAVQDDVRALFHAHEVAFTEVMGQ